MSRRLPKMPRSRCRANLRRHSRPRAPSRRGRRRIRVVERREPAAAAAVQHAQPMSNRGEVMISRRSVLLTLAFATLGACAVLAAPRSALVRMFDSDNDGTLDLAEVKKAASALFARLDRDHDGTLDRRELAGRLSAKELAAADPDHDGTLTAAEYLAVVEQRFNAANPDKDGTLDAKELNTTAGRALLRLMR